MKHRKYYVFIVSVALASIAIGFYVAAGWVFNVALLKSVIDGLAPMNFNTALGFILSGCCLLLTVRKASRTIVGVLSTLLSLTGAISFFGHLFHFRSTVASAFFPESVPMASGTALCFLMMGLSFLGIRSQREIIRSISQYLLHAASAVALLAIIGYLYGVPAFYHVVSLSSIEIQTAVLLFILPISASLINWKKGITGLFTGGDLGNKMAKKIFPVVLLVALVGGYFRTVLYKSHAVSIEFGIAAVTLIFILLSLILIAIAVSQLNSINRQRVKAEELLRFLDLAPDAIVVVDQGGIIKFANTQTEKTFGYSNQELIGKEIEMLIPERFRDPHGKRYFSAASLNPMGVGMELFGKRKNGAEIPVEISLSPIDTDAGLVISAAIRDISERKIAERQLKESEEKFNKAFHTSPAGITLTNQATRKWIDVNDSFSRMMGYDKTELIGRSSAELGISFTSDIDRIWDQLTTQGSVKNEEAEFRKKDGEVGTALFSIEKIVINNEPCFISLVYDISERKKTEEMLFKTQRLLETFMMNTPTMNWIIDEKNRFRFLNDSYMKAFHLTPQDIGRSLYEIFPANICDAFIENNWRVWNSGHALETVEEGVGPQGEKQIYQIFKFPLDPEDGLKLLGGVALDITSDIINRQQLWLSNERYNYVSKATSDAIWDWDVATDKIYRGEGYKTLFGHEETVSSLEMNMNSTIHPADADRVRTELENALKGTAFHWQSEYRFKSADGSYKLVVDKAYIIRNGQGEAIRMIGAVQDVTEQRRLQEHLAQEEERKKQEVLRAIIHAQERERHEISHELHDNVSQILTTCKLLLEAAVQRNDQKYLEQTKENLQKAIDEMRNISHRLNPATLKYIGLKGSITDLLSNINNTGSIAISFFSALRATEIEKIGDDVQLALFRIVQEQLNNILKHSEAKKVTINLQKEGNKIRLTISDDGKGHDLQEKKHGLGLTNILNRAEFHKGTARIFTEPGKGFKLQVEIPVP